MIKTDSRKSIAKTTKNRLFLTDANGTTTCAMKEKKLGTRRSPYMIEFVKSEKNDSSKKEPSLKKAQNIFT